MVAAGPALAAPVSGHSTAAPAATSDPHGLHAELPRPTGPHAVGREILHLVDKHRRDPWVPSAGPRQLMVPMYYPARPGTGGPAPYMTTEAARLMLQMKLPGTTIPGEAVSGTRTWGRSDARPEHGRFPLVMLSPGFTMPRTELTSLAEDLSSRGLAGVRPPPRTGLARDPERRTSVGAEGTGSHGFAVRAGLLGTPRPTPDDALVR